VNGDFRIGPWLVQPSLNSISQNGTSTRLENKVMEVLVCLADQSGHVVSKERLLQAVWPDTFVTDDVLKRSISELRRVLKDDARESQIIETIPKRGYRLIAPVVHINREAAPRTKSSEPPLSEEPRSPRSTWHPALIALCVGAMLFAILTAVNVVRVPKRPGAIKGPRVVHSVAVLPLKPLSNDPDQTYLAYGMTDELITVLSHIQNLEIASHTSVTRYENTDIPLQQIARDLNVDGVIEGAVQRSGERVRINVQLVHAASDKHLWAETYDRDLRDVLAVESEVAAAVAEAIQLRLTPQDQLRLQSVRPVNPRALDAYLSGRHHLTKSIAEELNVGQEETSQADFRQALNDFETAIREDPNYTRPYLAIFDALDAPQVPHLELLPRARAAIEQVLTLDGALPEAHADLARLHMLYEYKWDWNLAGSELRRAIELNTGHAGPHYLYSDYLDAVGRVEEAEREGKLAEELDLDCKGARPLNDVNCFGDEAHVDQLRNYLEATKSENVFEWGRVAKELNSLGRYEEAISAWQKTMLLGGYGPIAHALGRANKEKGYRAALKVLADGFEEEAARRYVPRILLAQAQIDIGNRDRAFFWLEKAYKEHNWCMLYLTNDPTWDPVRSDPRFKDLLRRVGLPVS
jgi:TolB-like protein/DNA-binding winged helix-turn-helix (wHTH) protein/Tfp pilus assembly protein PilF